MNELKGGMLKNIQIIKMEILSCNIVDIKFGPQMWIQ